MKISFLVTLLATLTLHAQRGVTDIPDPDPQKQKNAFNLPEGMEIELFASDPMMSKPVQINWDAQGRLWLVSSGMYPHILPGAEENDSIIILEDTNGDGKADKRTVFADNLHIPTAVQPADGGAYVANSTEILFLKDTDGDGKADHRQVVLSGFGTEDTHHLVHTFKTGPDGMLYFLQSIYIHSHLETPHGVRRLMGGGIWHLRPETMQAEILSKGLINPWGFIFDKYGQTFATDGAGGHGINFVFPRSVFRASPGSARHLNGLNPGSPKLCGLEVLSGSHIPEKYRGLLIAPDFRGHRINTYKLQPKGSTYTSTRVEDFLSSSHRAFRPIDVKMGPDGAVYIADWYNPIIQHGEVDFRDKRRDHTRGRIWRVSFKDQPLSKKQNFTKFSTEDLLKTLTSTERFDRDQARLQLRQRANSEVMPHLDKWTNSLNKDHDRLEALWTYQARNKTNIPLLQKLILSEDPRYRAAALRHLYHRHSEIPGASQIASLAISDPNPQVRLWAISCLAQMPSTNSVPTALKALDQEVDKPIDFALWSIVREHQDHWVPQFQEGKKPFGDNLKHLVFAAKALGKPLALETVFTALQNDSLSPQQQNEALQLIGQIGTEQDLSKLLNLIDKNPTTIDALITAKSLRRKSPTQGQEKILPLLDSKNPQIFSKASKLAGLWKYQPAWEKLTSTLKTNPKKGAAAARALSYFGGRDATLFFDKIIKDQTSSEALRIIAVRELANLAPKMAAPHAIQFLTKDDGTDQNQLLATFLKNPRSSTALARALKDQTLPTAIATLGVQRAGTSGRPPKDLIAALTKAGNLKPMTQTLSPEEMDKLANQIKTSGNPHRGEDIYRRTALQCTTCHAIGNTGGLSGPNLLSIGASAPIDYLITSLINPNDKIKEGYHTTLVTENNGNTHSGGLISENDQEIVLRGFDGKQIRIPKNNVKSTFISPVSGMPPGLTASLREDEFVDLVRFLSELGKEGEFQTSSRPLIRNWKALQPHKRTVDQIGHYGASAFAEKFEGYTWTPIGSKVNGELPVAELPKVTGRGRLKWGVVRFGLKPELQGKISLNINDTSTMHLFDGKKEIPLPDNGPATIKVAAGGPQDRFTIAINTSNRSTPLLVETKSE